MRKSELLLVETLYEFPTEEHQCDQLQRLYKLRCSRPFIFNYVENTLCHTDKGDLCFASS